MLENQLLQKSSDHYFDPIEQNSEKNSSNIYFDVEAAVSSFESEIEKQEFQVVDSRTQKYLSNAQVLIKHKEYDLALNILRQASTRDSKNPSVLKMLGNCLEKKGNFQEAIFARKALVKYDYGFESLYLQAACLYKLGQDELALEKYYEALSVLKEENSQLFEAYKNMGNIFVRQGDFEGAEEFYNKAYTMNSHSDILLVNLGTLQVQRNDFEKSLYCFRKAVEVNSLNDKAWVGLAMVHNQLGDSDLAWANLQSAIDINPANRTAVHLLANWSLRDKKIKAGISALQQYLGSVESDEDMSLVLINLLCSDGQIEWALLEMERVLLWNPEHQEVKALKKRLSKTVGAA